MNRFNVSAWALAHQSVVRYLMVVLLLSGLWSWHQLGQDEDPPFTFKAMVVQAQWPGATATEMSEQVASHIERALQQVPWADKIVSQVQPGRSITMLQLDGAAPAAEVSQLWYTARKQVGDMAASLPEGVQGPYFNDDFGDTYGLIYAFSGDGYDAATLREYADQARQQLLRVPEVAKVDLFGVQEERIYIELSGRRMAQLGLSVSDIADAIRGRNDVQAAGVVTLPDDQLQVRVSGALTGLDDLRALNIPIPVRATDEGGARGGGAIRLGDIAALKRGYVDPPVATMRYGDASGAREVIGLGVVMAEGGNILRLGERLDQEQARMARDLPVGVELLKVADQPRAVEHSIGEFVQVLLEAMVIVLVVSFVSLGLRRRPLRIDIYPGLVVALTIPLVLAGTFLVMGWLGINLHKISLGALIIALGLLVDDAIIAVEMMVRKMEEGCDRITAATEMYRTTAFPMLTGTLITALGFLPIAFAKSAAGEYTFSIFAVTALALMVSWVAAVVFTPLLGYWLLRPERLAHHGVKEGDVFDTPFYRRLRGVVVWCLDYRWAVIVLTLAALAASAFSFRYIEQQFFPESNRPELLVDLWLPEGVSYQHTEAAAREVEAWLSERDEVADYLTWVGMGTPRFYLPLDAQFQRSNLAQFVITPHNVAARDALRQQLDPWLQANFPDVRARVRLLNNGPPVAYPVQFRVQGPDPAVVRAVANDVAAVVAADPAARGVNDNWNNPVQALRLHLDQDRAQALGVSTAQLQQTAQMLVSGLPVATYREDDRRIPILLRQPADERMAMTRLAETMVGTNHGYVPLAQLVSVSLEWEPGILWRYNRDYAATVQADVVDTVQGQTVSSRLDPQLDVIRASLPAGYRIEMAGAAEESGTAQASIVANVPLMLFIVMTLLVLQLNGFVRALIVYLTGPLGVIGAALALLITGLPFGFVAQLGVIALLGMIIRNSVILIDQAERNRAEGCDAWTALVESAVRRARPILLTAATAVLAMIPLARTGFWGPMAVSIMGGLLVATVLTLLFLPALYAAVYRLRRPDVAPPQSLR